jgi:glycosyltransferase involved in cell wall biosynthesis
VRILVVSTLYPPVAFGGYEVECSGVVERLRERHEVQVLTSSRDRSQVGAERGVARTLELLSPDWRGALRAPRAALHAAAAARAALEFDPELIYVWNASSIPQAAVRVLADSGTPLAFRVCEHWFGGLFSNDQFMRELLPAQRSLSRRAWSLACRTLNCAPSLRLQATAPLRAAISWNSQAIERMVQTPSFVEVTLERVTHSVPRYGSLYEELAREPAPTPEIVFLGRVTPYKGIAVAVEALALLRSEHGIEAKLEVIGPEDVDYGREMRSLSERLGVAGAVNWHGQQAPEQAAAVLARAHALIVPSVWDEPFPLVTIEGAFARVPLVAADVGGISEGMHDREHALLFARGDAAAAAAALAQTLSDPGATAARVERALERARQFRLAPYLDAQERFVEDAAASLAAAAGEQPTVAR